MKNPLFVLMITVSAILLCPVMVFAFHINPASDALTSEQAQSYVEKPVSTVTGALGAPSLVRKNVTDANSIDYIFIGNNQVFTFQVKIEGKVVTAYTQDARVAWESAIYPVYPA